MIPCITISFYAKTNSDRPGKAAIAAVGAQLLFFLKAEPLPQALVKKIKKLSRQGFEPRELERGISGLTAALKEDLCKEMFCYHFYSLS